jgi:Meiotically up-regulated gene 113
LAFSAPGAQIQVFRALRAACSRELYASVPFHYDVHAMVFSDDAVGLETRLHHEFADRRVNLVNVRREFFRASPAEVRDVLARHQVSIIQWTDERRLENGSVILTYVPG